MDAAQVMRPDPAKSDGEQGSSPRALKQEGERNPSVDICSSAACNIEEGSKGQAANVNGCEQSVELMARCPSHNPNRVQRMSGCIARGLLTSDDVEASVPALGKVEPENCQHSQVCSLDQDENKSRGDTDVHKKVDNKSTVTLGGHEEDVHNENCHSDLPVNSAEAYSSFRLNLNEGFLRESSRGSHSELANKDKTLDQADSDSIHSYTGETVTAKFIYSPVSCYYSMCFQSVFQFLNFSRLLLIACTYSVLCYLTSPPCVSLEFECLYSACFTKASVTI